MAPAILARPDESNPPETIPYMKKPHPTINPNPNPNPNPTLSGKYITFHISDYSKKDLRDLKCRLESELHQVRSLTARIKAWELSSRSPPRSFLKIKKMAMMPPESERALAAMMSKCRQILVKLMKYKGSDWFNAPVDVEALNLPDYHHIIKHPMDLGTVKEKFNNGLYATPMEFASDIRLTFHNAILYNPKQHFVNTLADQMLCLFESEFGPAYKRYEQQLAAIAKKEERQREADSVPCVKQEAEDLSERAMSMEEKGKLHERMESLPEEKTGQLLEIVGRMMGYDKLVKEGNEFVLDLGTMDSGTLWEIDRFVGNWERLEREMKIQEVKVSSMICTPPSDFGPVEDGDKHSLVGKKMIKKGDTEDEDDVDIGEETQNLIYPPVEIEKDNNGNASSYSSSSSGSSDSDSDSSSSSASVCGGHPQKGGSDLSL